MSTPQESIMYLYVNPYSSLTITLLSSISVAIIGLLAVWMRSFLRKKAENAATKQDIESITVKIEGIKHDYSTKLEGLKADINVLSSQRNLLNEKGHDCFIQFFETTLSLIKDKLEVNLGDIGSMQTAPDELFSFQQSVERLITQLQVDYHKLLLYHGDKPLIVQAAHETVLKAINARKSFRKNFHPAKDAISEYVQNWKPGQSTKFDFALEKKYYDELNPALVELRESFTNYLNNLQEYIGNANPEVVVGGIDSA